MSIFEVTPDRLVELPTTTFATHGFRERGDLQRLLRCFARNRWLRRHAHSEEHRRGSRIDAEQEALPQEDHENQAEGAEETGR